MAALLANLPKRVTAKRKLDEFSKQFKHSSADTTDSDATATVAVASSSSSEDGAVKIKRLTKSRKKAKVVQKNDVAATTMTTPLEIEPSKLCGEDFRIGDTRFISSKTLYRTEFDDYTLITNVDFTPYIKYAPREIKPLLASRWMYVMHVSHGMQPSITRNILQARVTGGEILAYKYTECSIEGNECVYYGFLPVLHSRNRLASTLSCGTHRICRVSMMEVWPRKLFIYMKRDFQCPCSENCTRWHVTLKEYPKSNQCCIKTIPWHDLYIMMGDGDRKCMEIIKVPRTCFVCAQCYDCSKSPNYCRKHRICKHKLVKIFNDITTSSNQCSNNQQNPTIICDSKMKSCIKYK